MRLLDPSRHGLFALLTNRFAQDDFTPKGHPEQREGSLDACLSPQPRQRG